MAAVSGAPATDVFWHLNLTPEQHKLLDEFTGMLSEQQVLVAGLDDQYSLARFLKARQWHPRRAARMYQAMAAWRQEHKVEAVVESFQFKEMQEVRRLYPHFYHNTDKWGRPVYYELLGKVDLDGLLRATTMERFLNYHIQCCESLRRDKLPACSAVAGLPIVSQTVVLDLEGFSMAQFNLTVKRFLETVSRVDQDNFPEHLGCMFLINAPLMFRGAWAFIKPFLDERTLAKIKVLGSSYKKELLQVIPHENLPVRFGGSSACNELQDMGPWRETLFDRIAARSSSGQNLRGDEEQLLGVEVAAAGGTEGEVHVLESLKHILNSALGGCAAVAPSTVSDGGSAPEQEAAAEGGDAGAGELVAPAAGTAAAADAAVVAAAAPLLQEAVEQVGAVVASGPQLVSQGSSSLAPPAVVGSPKGSSPRKLGSLFKGLKAAMHLHHHDHHHHHHRSKRRGSKDGSMQATPTAGGRASTSSFFGGRGGAPPRDLSSCAAAGSSVRMADADAAMEVHVVEATTATKAEAAACKGSGACGSMEQAAAAGTLAASEGRESADERVVLPGGAGGGSVEGCGLESRMGSIYVTPMSSLPPSRGTSCGGATSAGGSNDAMAVPQHAGIAVQS